MRQTYYVIDGQRCRRCGACERVCPHGALAAAVPTAPDGAPASNAAAPSDGAPAPSGTAAASGGAATSAAGREAPVIDQARCRHCGMCFRACRFNAVTRPYELYQLRDGRSL